MHCLHSKSFSDLAAFLSAPPSNFPAKVEESSRFVSEPVSIMSATVAVQKMLNKILLLNQHLTSLKECRIVNQYAKLLNGLILIGN